MLRGQQCVRKPATPTSAPFQHLLALAVSASSFLYPACGHEGVDCGKIKRGLPVPPALALCIFPHVRVLFVYLGCYSILIGDVSISLWKEQQQQHAAFRHTFISFDPFYYFWSLPSTLSAAHIFPDVSRSHASFLSDMRKLLWYVKLHSSSMQEPPWPYFSSSSAMTSTAPSAVSALSSPSLEDEDGSETALTLAEWTVFTSETESRGLTSPDPFQGGPPLHQRSLGPTLLRFQCTLDARSLPSRPPTAMPVYSALLRECEPPARSQCRCTLHAQDNDTQCWALNSSIWAQRFMSNAHHLPPPSRQHRSPGQDGTPPLGLHRKACQSFCQKWRAPSRWRGAEPRRCHRRMVACWTDSVSAGGKNYIMLLLVSPTSLSANRRDNDRVADRGPIVPQRTSSWSFYFSWVSVYTLTQCSAGAVWLGHVTRSLKSV